jgi:uncharacterized protein (DUF885 family)
MNIPLLSSSPESNPERPSERVQNGARWIIGNAENGVARIEHAFSMRLTPARAAIESTASSESARQIDELYERMGLNGAPAAVSQTETSQNVQATNGQVAPELNVDAIRANLDNIYEKPAAETNPVKTADVLQFPISSYDTDEGDDYAKEAA